MIDLLVRLAPRERVLLGVLFGLVLPLAVIFAVLIPLSERRAAAEADLMEARALAVGDPKVTGAYDAKIRKEAAARQFVADPALMRGATDRFVLRLRNPR